MHDQHSYDELMELLSKTRAKSRRQKIAYRFLQRAYNDVYRMWSEATTRRRFLEKENVQLREKIASLHTQTETLKVGSRFLAPHLSHEKFEEAWEALLSVEEKK